MNHSNPAYNEELLLFSARNTKSHFIFNTLTALEYLFRHDPSTANYAFTHFTSYLRMNLDTAKMYTLIPFNDELNHCIDYITLINIRYQCKLLYNIYVDDDDFLVPPLCICALVENAFKHGIAKKDSTGSITINVSHTLHSIVISVENDGPAYNNEPYGHGLNDTQTRLDKYLNASLSLEVNPSSGTTVATVTIPH